ncbi:hypothetical protein E2P81_ATG08667 [Venturia nashicola]|uniref:Uncharacterized protein n=1 Tax=Venturia nashicola TaxID=86259 RepID=A0A4Z1P2Z8_9PEZI|nr:hypothetical protein E6O75_ATG08858 [Venturia nashicola]TLD21003.1 hypothetical protein E2P81_ATG08667 [Venturia nashicola]
MFLPAIKQYTVLLGRHWRLSTLSSKTPWPTNNAISGSGVAKWRRRRFILDLEKKWILKHRQPPIRNSPFQERCFMNAASDEQKAERTQFGLESDFGIHRWDALLHSIRAPLMISFDDCGVWRKKERQLHHDFCPSRRQNWCVFTRIVGFFGLHAEIMQGIADYIVSILTELIADPERWRQHYV